MTRAARRKPAYPAPDQRIYRQPRHHGIHLVSSTPQTGEVVADFRVMGEDWLRLQQAREARRLRIAAMTLGAAFAPAVWMLHELFARLSTLR